MLWLILFLDLTSIPTPRGDDALYRQAMADHHLKGAYDFSAGFNECLAVAQNGSELRTLASVFLNANWRPSPRPSAAVHFSYIGWEDGRAFVELKTSDATSCLLYRRSGASFRLLREIRLPR
jgi:hypothetical protein